MRQARTDPPRYLQVLQHPQTMPDRVLEFPEDVEVGRLFCYKTGHDRPSWSGPARGTVHIPDGNWVHLSPDMPIRGLNALEPDALDSIQLPKRAATNEDLRRIAHLTRLRELHLSKSNLVTDVGLLALSRLTELRWLDIYWSAVTDVGLRAVAGMIHLEQLHLGLTRIQGPGLAWLVGLHRLKRLSVEETDVGDGSLHHLTRLGGLKKLALWGTRVSTRGLKTLQAALPDTAIEMRDPGQRLARELGRRGVLRALVLRLCPDLPRPFDPVERAAALLPEGTVITGRLLSRDHRPARDVRLGVKDLWLLALVLGHCRGDLHVRTPDGRDRRVRWL